MSSTNSINRFEYGRKILLFFILLIFSYTFSSAREKEKFFFKDGISFTLPKKWKVVNDEQLSEGGYYFSAEKNFKKSSSLFAYQRIEEKINPVTALILQQSKMKSGDNYRESGIEFTAISEAKLGGLEVKKVEYESIIKKQKIRGMIYSFNCSGRTFLLFFQTTYDDWNANKKIFQKIRQSFACR